MGKKFARYMIAIMLCGSGLQAQPAFNPEGAFFAGAISFGTPVLVTNTNSTLAVPRFSVINPITISGNVSTVIFSNTVNANTGMTTRESHTLTNTAVTTSNVVRTILSLRGITTAGWSLGMLSRPPADLEGSWPWDLGLSDKEIVAYRTVSNVITQIEEGLTAEGFEVAFDLPEESHQRGRITYDDFSTLRGFASTNFIGVYVSLPAMQIRSNFSTPSFPELKASVVFTNLLRTNSVRIPEVPWWGTNNWPLPWVGSAGATPAGNLRGFGP